MSFTKFGCSFPSLLTFQKEPQKTQTKTIRKVWILIFFLILFEWLIKAGYALPNKNKLFHRVEVGNPRFTSVICSWCLLGMTVKTSRLSYSMATVSGARSNLLNLVNLYNDHTDEQLWFKECATNSWEQKTKRRVNQIIYLLFSLINKED